MDGTPLEDPNAGKNLGAVVIGRLGGQKGGNARAAALSQERRRGSLPQFGCHLKGRSGRTRRSGHRSFKAIRKIGGTGSASVAVMLASTWIAEHPCNLGCVRKRMASKPTYY